MRGKPQGKGPLRKGNQSAIHSDVPVTQTRALPEDSPSGLDKPDPKRDGHKLVAKEEEEEERAGHSSALNWHQPG